MKKALRMPTPKMAAIFIRKPAMGPKSWEPAATMGRMYSSTKVPRLRLPMVWAREERMMHTRTISSTGV